MSAINEVLGPLRNVSWLNIKGKALCGQRTYLEQHMYVFQYKIANGAHVDASDLPYGYFLNIEPFNAAESVMEIIAAPREGDTPIFNDRVTSGTNMNEFICGYETTTTIVPIGTPPDSGADIWESTVTPIDDKHAEKKTTRITSYNVVVQDEWDETLNVSVRTTSELTQIEGTASISIVGGLVTRTLYSEVRCGWFVKSSEAFSVVSRSYSTTIDFYWPAILSDIVEYIYDLKAGGSETYLSGVFSKEAYHGPCKATVTETWSVTAPVTDAPTIFQPLPVDIDTPFAGKSFGPTLHGTVTFNISINGDAKYEDVVANYSWPATTPTTWPSTAIASDSVDPIRGGYLRRRIVVNAPS